MHFAQLQSWMNSEICDINHHKQLLNSLLLNVTLQHEIKYLNTAIEFLSEVATGIIHHLHTFFVVHIVQRA